MKKENIIIRKASGEQAVFDAAKLRLSLEHSGANDEVITQIVDKVENSLYDGITTKEIYSKAFSLLRKNSPPSAARYKLKKAIYELGPTGFPFEKFISEILRHQGYETKVDVLVEGNCVTHEIDVVAKKNEKHFMVECKFHNDQGRFCDVKIPLYIHSRFQDIENQTLKQKGGKFKFEQGWIVTNTRFTTDAVQYGNCAGLNLIGWNHPKKGSLKERIDLSGLHPITSLTTISKFEKKQLLEKENVLCVELKQNPEILKSIGISGERQKRILKEVEELCCPIKKEQYA